MKFTKKIIKEKIKQIVMSDSKKRKYYIATQYANSGRPTGFIIGEFTTYKKANSYFTQCNLDPETHVIIKGDISENTTFDKRGFMHWKN